MTRGRKYLSRSQKHKDIQVFNLFLCVQDLHTSVKGVHKMLVKLTPVANSLVTRRLCIPSQWSSASSKLTISTLLPFPAIKILFIPGKKIQHSYQLTSFLVPLDQSSIKRVTQALPQTIYTAFTLLANILFSCNYVFLRSNEVDLSY